MPDTGTSIIVGFTTVLMPVVMLLATYYVKRQEEEGKNEVKSNELLEAQLAATNAAKDKIDAELRDYRTLTEHKLEVFRETVASLIARVHALELWVLKNGIPALADVPALAPVPAPAPEGKK